MEEFRHIADLLQQVQGYIYPNEVDLQWGLIIVIYPYLTGLVAGAFILASLEKVFQVKAVQPTYRMALLTAFAFLLAAPLPLLVHLGHQERALEMFMTPNLTSAMAMFGFVYAWYLMVVLAMEIWFDYRADLIRWAREEPTWWQRHWIHRAISLFSTDTSARAVAFDHHVVHVLSIIGIPSAFLLHGYVGFIFGSVKANPWWSSVLMPIVFIFSAIVSGIALVMLIYMVVSWLRSQESDLACLDTITNYLMYAIIIDFALEMLDFIQRVYEAEEALHIFTEMVRSKLLISLVGLQVLGGILVPLLVLVAVKILPTPPQWKRLAYFGVAVLVQIGIFAMRWNVIMGGQFFSKSLRGLTTYKLQFWGLESLPVAIVLLLIPFGILGVLFLILPPWEEAAAEE